MSIWTECHSQGAPSSITNQLIRVVESQEQIATTHLVDNSLDEQQLLEEMLDVSKPIISIQWQQQYHYLLFTPFRYPPLMYGSRFGTRSEPSLFYGSLSIETAFSEMAYYRLLFWHHMETAPTDSLLTQHTRFGVGYKSDNAIKLYEAPYASYTNLISNPSDYLAAQELGSEMREHGVELFEYKSARHEDGINVALYSPENFTSKKPDYTCSCMCETKRESISIKDNDKVYTYTLSQYLVNGELPRAA